MGVILTKNYCEFCSQNTNQHDLPLRTMIRSGRKIDMENDNIVETTVIDYYDYD